MYGGQPLGYKLRKVGKEAFYWIVFFNPRNDWEVKVKHNLNP